MVDWKKIVETLHDTADEYSQHAPSVSGHLHAAAKLCEREIEVARLLAAVDRMTTAPYGKELDEAESLVIGIAKRVREATP